MNKTLITREYEFLVYDYLYLQRGYSSAMEVRVPFLGRADVVGVKDKDIIVVEIKTSVRDFNSKSGHNLVGTRNYYAMPMEVYLKVQDKVPSHVGVLSYTNKKLRVIKNARLVKHNYPDRFYEVLNKSIDTAKQSNIRRLLYHRYKLKK